MEEMEERKQIEIIQEKTGYQFSLCCDIFEEKKRIIEEMKKGNSCFSYMKKDGTRRNAVGTIINAPDYDEEKISKHSNPLVVYYYDVFKEAWRCFNVTNLIVNED